ncbi:hypothetical protein TNCV_1910561 [Trichonephila clavipes]|nr:hypothetical protein TNCV_1910561 [Trichonephila clavipes]
MSNLIRKNEILFAEFTTDGLFINLPYLSKAMIMGGVILKRRDAAPHFHSTSIKDFAVLTDLTSIRAYLYGVWSCVASRIQSPCHRNNNRPAIFNLWPIRPF